MGTVVTHSSHLYDLSLLEGIKEGQHILLLDHLEQGIYAQFLHNLQGSIRDILLHYRQFPLDGNNRFLYIRQLLFFRGIILHFVRKLRYKLMGILY